MVWVECIMLWVDTCVAIQPQLVDLLIHDGGVPHKYIELYCHSLGSRVEKPNQYNFATWNIPLPQYKHRLNSY